MSKNFVNPTKVITGPNTRWSYANVWEAKSINGGAPKFSVSLIIPKSDTKTIEKIKAAIQAAYEEGESKLKGNGKTVPALSVLKTPLRDGDLERPDDEAYANAFFVNANSGTAPGIVDADRQPILDHSEVYSGVYGRASINFYAFNSNGNKGIQENVNTNTGTGLEMMPFYNIFNEWYDSNCPSFSLAISFDPIFSVFQIIQKMLHGGGDIGSFR